MTARFHPRGDQSRGWIVFALLLLHGCTEEPAGPSAPAPLGIQIPAHADRPALEIAVLVSPAPKDEIVVKAVSRVIAGAFDACTTHVEPGAVVAVDAGVAEGKLREPRAAASDPLTGCVTKALDGRSVAEWGSDPRAVELQIRAAR